MAMDGPVRPVSHDAEVSVETLFRKNIHRRWPSALIRLWKRQQKGYDIEAIRWWMKKFEDGESTTLHVHKRTLEVADGNHRLIAAYFAHLPTIKVKFVR